MTSPQQLHILHLTDNNRGGSQRHILDLCRSRSAGFRHFILRVGPDVVGLHDVEHGRLLVLDAERLTGGWPVVLRAITGELAIGCIHAHALEPLLQAHAAQAVDLAQVVVTLHDLRAIDPQFFTAPRAQPSADPAWVARCEPVLRKAAALVVPSEWMAGVVRQHYPDASPQVVENGVAQQPLIEQSVSLPWSGSRRVYAVVGALGAHKGSQTLARVARAIDDPDVVGVVIGYTEEQPAPGWAVPDKLYVHGRYLPEELPGLLRAYGCRIAYFPNLVPESFSYVLSEVWHAKLPVVAPRVGALGARVERSGGGWLLDDPLDATRAAALLVELLSPAGSARVEAAAAALAANPHVAGLESMRDAIERLYASIGWPAAHDASTGWIRLAAGAREAGFSGIDDSLLDAQWPVLVREESRLRQWNAKLAGDVTAVESSARRMQVHFAECVTRAKTLDDDVRTLKARNDRIEADAAALREQIAALSEVGRIQARNVALEQHMVALRARNLRVEDDIKALVARNAQLEGDVVALTQRNIELDADVVALKERNLEVESGLASIKARNARVELDAATLRAELDSTRGRLSDIDRELALRERALSVLPSPLQNWLLRHAR